MKRKIGAVLLAMLVAAAVGMYAMAAAEIVNKVDYTDAYSVDLNRESGTIVYRGSSDNAYKLIDAQGNALTSAAYLKMDDNGFGFDVAVAEGLNTTGFIDAQGKELVPMAYGDIMVIDEKWQIGIVLENATGENYDYKNFAGDTFYLVSAYDIYYKGAKVGSLDRMGLYSAEAYGNFLHVKDRNGGVHYYDSAMNESAYTGEESMYNEYVYDYKSGAVWHCGSNQQAFTAGCTLTSEDVVQDLYFVKGQCLDLQGNVVFEQGAYEPSGRWENGYHKVRGMNGLYGIVDRAGSLVVPCEYDEIWSGTYDGYLGSGYQAVVKDGKVGYVNAKGEVTCPFTYAQSVVGSAYSPVAKVKNMEGNYILLSAAVGELPGSYAYAYTYEGCPLIQVEYTDGTYGVIDMYGNTVLSGLENSSINIAHDGSTVVCYTDYRAYSVYSLAYNEQNAVVNTAPVAQETGEGQTAPAAGWICTCGAENNGNFCVNCGAAKPAPVEEAVEDGSWACVCGATNTGNFCPNCGSAKPAETLACKGCGYVPEGEAPKFCPECGTQF